jgi:putative ABC transport system ATP-binding protein
MGSETALEVHGLTRTFRRGGDTEIRALQDVSLTLQQGEFVVVLGTNGSGKSTLLNEIAGGLPPESGTIEIAGQDVTRWPEHRRARLVARAFQNPFTGTAPNLTVAENLALAAQRGSGNRLAPALGRERMEMISQRVAELGMELEDRLETPMGQLSGGQRQALTLLMATLVRPELLLLDEHTAALDPRMAEKVMRLTQKMIHREGLTTLMVTHALPQAIRYGDRVIMMHRGRIAVEFSGAAKRMMRVQDLLDRFDQLRAADLLDESAEAMLRRLYV